MTQTIPLTRGREAIVDDADFEELAQWSWHVISGPYATYAARYERGTRGTVYMHRIITEAPKGSDVDHVNHNGLDNRRCNLRVCTRQENQRNRRTNRNGSSRYKGVCRVHGKWMAYYHMNTRHIHIGMFASEEDAARAYNAAALEYFGEFARLNVIGVDATDCCVGDGRDDAHESGDRGRLLQPGYGCDGSCAGDRGGGASAGATAP